MVQSVAYNAASQITSMQYLQYAAGPLWLTETRQYNVRLQMTSQTVAPSGGGAALMDLRYNYSATQNNGRIGSMQDLVSGETVTYQYDELQRLIAASAAGWGNSYTFDGFGNLLSKTVTGGSAPSLAINVDGNTNRITTGGYGYDLNGNLTTLPGVTGIAYDADNRLTAANGEQYGYAPTNQRVWLKKGGIAIEHFTFYGVDGARLGVYTKANYSAPMTGSYFTVVKEEVYFAGKRIRSGNLAVAEDRLGSTRREDTTASRFYPYGEENGSTANDRQKFGTYYRDAGTQLDYANQRYYSASIGRFLTADPYQASGGPADPGSWNRYAYVHGDPANWRDPAGTTRCYVDIGRGPEEVPCPPGDDQVPYIPSAPISPGPNDPADPLDAAGLGGSPNFPQVATGSKIIASRGAGELLKAEKCAKAVGYRSSSAASTAFDSLSIVTTKTIAPIRAQLQANGKYRLFGVHFGQRGPGPNTISISDKINWMQPTQQTAFVVEDPLGPLDLRNSITFDLLKFIATEYKSAPLADDDFRALVILHEIGHVNGLDADKIEFNEGILRDCLGLL